MVVKNDDMDQDERYQNLGTNTRHQFFIKRLQELGVYDRDSDYAGLIGKAVEELSETFSVQGHSGESAVITIRLFNQLMAEYNRGPII